MKKAIAVLFLLVGFSCRSSATDQHPDQLLYNNLTFAVSVGWGHPSPLEVYFLENRLRSPFRVLSTANYRGHVATWQVEHGRLYLRKIAVENKTYLPKDYKIKAKNDSLNASLAVFADWFSGVIECFREGKSGGSIAGAFYFHVRRGEVISCAEVTADDLQQIRNLSASDAADSQLAKKMTLLQLNQNYIAYYYRLTKGDLVHFRGKVCRLSTGIEKLSPIYSLYENQHLKWPYNWENMMRSGAPSCRWSISNDSLMLEEVYLYRGLGLDSVESEKVELRDLFAKELTGKRVFANWFSGVQLIVAGIDSTTNFGYKQFQPTEYTYCRIEKGIIKEAFTIPSDFDLERNGKKLQPRARALLKEF